MSLNSIRQFDKTSKVLPNLQSGVFMKYLALVTILMFNLGCGLFHGGGLFRMPDKHPTPWKEVELKYPYRLLASIPYLKGGNFPENEMASDDPMLRRSTNKYYWAADPVWSAFEKVSPFDYDKKIHKKYGELKTWWRRDSKNNPLVRYRMDPDNYCYVLPYKVYQISVSSGDKPVVVDGQVLEKDVYWTVAPGVHEKRANCSLFEEVSDARIWDVN